MNKTVILEEEKSKIEFQGKRIYNIHKVHKIIKNDTIAYVKIEYCDDMSDGIITENPNFNPIVHGIDLHDSNNETKKQKFVKHYFYWENKVWTIASESVNTYLKDILPLLTN